MRYETVATIIISTCWVLSFLIIVNWRWIGKTFRRLPCRLGYHKYGKGEFRNMSIEWTCKREGCEHVKSWL